MCMSRLEGVHGGPGVGAVDADGADALVAGVLAQAQAVVLTEAENKIRTLQHLNDQAYTA